jgi:hypothetical protein
MVNCRLLASAGTTYAERYAYFTDYQRLSLAKPPFAVCLPNRYHPKMRFRKAGKTVKLLIMSITESTVVSF